MATLKYSRQRESIKNYLANTTEHPTADLIYMHVKKEFPNISLGTVYRNLNLLTDLGEAIKITSPDGGDRFDGNLTPHNHFYCKECGKILDLPIDEESTKRLHEFASEDFDGLIESSTITFFGKCRDCCRKP